MNSSETSSKTGLARPCTRCRKVHKKCYYYNETTCLKCHERKFDCSFANTSTTVITNSRLQKRKIEDVPDMEPGQAKRHSSSVNEPHNAVIGRDATQMQAQSLESSKPASQNQNSVLSEPCSMCQVSRQPSKSKLDSKMVRCDVKTCATWFHLSCIWFSKDPRRMVVFTAKGIKEAEFICPNCLDQDARQVIGSTIERLKMRTNTEGNTETESRIHLMSSLQGNANQQTQPSEMQVTTLQETREMGFEPAREEIYQGCDDGELRSLVSNLHQAIYDYNLEVCQAIDRFGDGNHACTKKPLAAWELNCACGSTIEAKPWYQTESPVGMQCMSHSSITAALRSLLNIPSNKPLEIDQKLKDLDFSQVHIAFIAWFAFDILNDDLRSYNLPNMTQSTCKMAAMYQSWEARWPESVNHFLREVELRAWYQDRFQNETFPNMDKLMRRMEAYLQPLTRGFGKISPYSHTRIYVIECTLKLLSYLRAAGGQWRLIEPMIGDPFNRQFHEAFDEKGIEQNPDKRSDKKVLWILNRGVHYTEDGINGYRPFIIKARVVVR